MSDHKSERTATSQSGEDVQRRNKDQKPKQATGAVGKGPQSGNKTAKEEKKKQKAERRVSY